MEVTEIGLRRWFTEKFLKGTCFDSIKELMADKTNIQQNAVRALIAVELKGKLTGATEAWKDGLRQRDCGYREELGRND